MKNKRNHLFFLWLCLAIVVIALPLSAATPNISLNGKFITTSAPPVVQNGSTLVPLRVISENLGASVSYSSAHKEITITAASQTIKLYINNKTASLNGSQLVLSAAPIIVNGATMVPLRFISEQLNCSVKWDAASQTVFIVSKSAASTPVSGKPIATMIIKDYGTVTLELYPDMAPNTVTNFMVLANKGFYDGLTFHRIIENFMIQGGDPLGNGTGGPSYSIPGEFSANGYTANTLSHTKGVISMARSSAPDSAGSQFFITSADVPYLDGQYAAFGKVTSGLNIIEAISRVQTDSSDQPLKTVVIESIRVQSNGYMPDTLNILNN